MSRERQVVWLNAEATNFAAPCEACLSDVEPRAAVVYAREASFHGSLSACADVGFMTCPRGHRIIVRRAFGPVGELSLRRF